MKITKILALLLAVVMCLALAACGGETAPEANAPEAGAPAAEEPAKEPAATPEADAPAEGELPAYKIGVILYDLTNDWSLHIQKDLEYLGEYLNLTFEYAVGGNDPEATLTAIQNFGAAGCDGLIDFHPGSYMTSSMEICEQYGMYAVIAADCASKGEGFEEYSKSEYYAGEVYQDDYTAAYSMVTMMIEDGAKTFALAGIPEGLSVMMDSRAKAARDAIADGGASILTEGLNFNKVEAVENILAQYPDVDAIFSSVETMSTTYQPLINANLAGSIICNSFDPAAGLLEAMEEGVITYTADGNNAAGQCALILLYNAITGNILKNADGSVPDIRQEYIVARGAEQYSNVLTYITEGELPPYTFDELKPYIVSLSPDATAEAFEEFASAFSLDEVIARR